MKTKSRMKQSKTLLISDLVNSTQLIETLGIKKATTFFTQHDRLARDLLNANFGQEIDKSDGFLVVFENPLHAVYFAHDYHAALASLSREFKQNITARVGIHVGEVIIRKNPIRDVERGAKPVEVEGIAKPLTARLMSLADGKQTLLSRAAFDLARKHAEHSSEPLSNLFWQAHGAYTLKGISEAVEVFEVGREGFSPLQPPLNTHAHQKLEEQDIIQGWRPIVGVSIPLKIDWVLKKCLGLSDFGEVWLACHRETGKKRAFKFCFNTEILAYLRKEEAQFSVLKEHIEPEDGIVMIYDWNFNEAPFYLEMEYVEGGNLQDIGNRRGFLNTLTLDARLDIVAQVARALAKAHSLGILHRDIKPSNILILKKSGLPQIKLSDFGLRNSMQFSHERMSPDHTTSQLRLSQDFYSNSRPYTAPEIFEGKPATTQSDIYSLGVLLYQLVLGDFTRILAIGWEREISDDLLIEDIAWMIDGSPLKRLNHALRVSDRLKSLEKRRESRVLSQQAEQQKTACQEALKRTRRIQLTAIIALILLSIFSIFFLREARRANIESANARSEAEASREMSVFLIKLFEAVEPDTGNRAETTAKEILDQGANRIREELNKNPKTRIRIMEVIAKVYKKLGLYTEAESLLKDARNITEKIYGSNNINYISDSVRLARLYTQMGNFASMEKELNAAQKGFNYLTENDEMEYMKLHVELLDEWSLLQTRQGEYKSATINLIKCIEIQKELYGAHDYTLNTSLTGLAEIYWLQARHGEAESLLREALDLKIAHLGPEHLDVAYATNNLAAVFREQGKYIQAIDLYTRTRRIFDKVLEQSHPDKASVLNNLATVYDDMKEYKTSGPLFEKALEIRLRNFDENHPLVAISLNNLATHLFFQGDLRRSEILNLRALDIRRKALGPRHRDVALSLQNLAKIHMKRGEVDNAIALLQESMDIRKETLAENHPDYASSQADLGRCYMRMHKTEEGIRLLEKALRVFENSQQIRSRSDWHETAQSLINAYTLVKRTNDADTLALRQNTYH